MMDKTDIQRQITEAAESVRGANPLVGSVTNAVTAGLVANAQLAVGGSAAIVYMPEESEILAKAGGSFYINVGTLLPLHERALPLTAKMLHDNGRPWVLDPVAAGIGSLRTGVLKRFKDYKPRVIRGNASEIMTLAGMWGLDGGGRSGVRGVDSTADAAAAKAAAAALAKWTEGAVAVSGETDLVTDGAVAVLSYGGSPLMKKMTGAGCSLGGVAAVYLAAASPFIAALTATAVYNLAGRRAGQKADGPGSFQAAFLDELHKAAAADIAGNPFAIEEL